MKKNSMTSISSNSSETDVPPAKPQTVSRTNWERLDALSDSEIDTSDIPPLTEDDFARSQWRFPASAESTAMAPSHAVLVEVAVDEDILAWFQSQGKDYPQRMRAALRLYAEAHRTSAL
jgi:uncharacterized protein (DUF4415 family)